METLLSNTGKLFLLFNATPPLYDDNSLSIQRELRAKPSIRTPVVFTDCKDELWCCLINVIWLQCLFVAHFVLRWVMNGPARTAELNGLSDNIILSFATALYSSETSG
jgi:hypothetical protein